MFAQLIIFVIVRVIPVQFLYKKSARLLKNWHLPDISRRQNEKNSFTVLYYLHLTAFMSCLYMYTVI